MINLENAVVYDIETLPNCFLLHARSLNSDDIDLIFEISQFRDDRLLLWQWFNYWYNTQTPMIGFNNLYFDYQVIHQFWLNPNISYHDLYNVAQNLIAREGRFPTIWESDRFAPQIDLFKIHHFDNRAKSTSLKALQVAMRLENVLEMQWPHDKPIPQDKIDSVLIPYNRWDGKSTKQFAHYSMEAINFRIGLSDQFSNDVLNWSDTKIGSKILEKRLGVDGRTTGTIRHAIPLADIIFPYIRFNHPEFNRVLSWMKSQTLKADELTESIKTKGVFTGMKAHVGGIDFYFGTGGIHGSVESKCFVSTPGAQIYDIDVAGLYPSIAIVNGLYPEHLGARFVEEYAKLPAERKEWQKKKGKKCVEANSLKLAANGTYGNSNNQFSVFYDPKFTMSITINGQLLLCMLAERLLTIPTLEIIQINTDGITYRLNPILKPLTDHIQAQWERETKLVLEAVEYSRMWIRDVNNYVAEDTEGKLKQKGAYWFPRKFPDDVINAQPPAWHKDLSALVVIKAAVEHMTRGVDLEKFVYFHADPFDFMLRAKVDRSSRLYIGDTEVQRITRYYIARDGADMRKVSPPPAGATLGEYKRRNGIGDYEYYRIADTLLPGTWDERIHTKNKSRYVMRETGIQAGYKVAECNDVRSFNFNNLNYEWYVQEAKKLVIAG